MDDDDFLTPGSGTGLASIFGANRALDGTGTNPSLTYTAPKQPKKQSQNNQDSQQIFAAISVDCQKHVDGRYIPHGKVGCALIGSHSTKDYKLILYVSNSKHLSSTKVDYSFNFTIQSNNYASFYDDARQAWSLHFNTTEDAIKVSKEIAICKAVSMGHSLSQLVKQDLVLGEGQVIERGDSVEVKYIGSLLENNSIGKMFDSNTSSDKAFRYKIGQGKVIKGWEEGTVGMTKGGKRLLIIPPSLAYGSQGVPGRIPANATLVFEIEIRKVKFSKDKSVATPPKIETPPTERKSESTTVRARTHSIEESLTQSLEGDIDNRSELLSRISKMGQPMLPMATGITKPAVEQEHQSQVQQPQIQQPQVQQPQIQQQQIPSQVEQPVIVQPVIQQPPPQAPLMTTPIPQVINPTSIPMSTYRAPPTMSNQLALYQPPNWSQHTYQQPGGFMSQPTSYAQNIYGQPIPTMAPPPPMVPPTAMAPPPPPVQQTDTGTNTTLLSETRQNTTEVRLELAKLTSKIDDMSNKIDKIREEGGGPVGGGALTSRGGPTPSMETSVLLHNIQRIIQENEHLKRDVFEKSARIETQNTKIAELLERNQRFVEQSNTMLEQRSDAFKNTAAQSQVKVLQLEQEKVTMTTELSSTTAQLSSLHMELGEMRKKELDIKQQLASTVTELQNSTQSFTILQKKQTELQSLYDTAASELKEEKLSSKKLRAEFQRVRDELEEVKNEKENVDKSLASIKSKLADKKRSWDEEIEELKSQYEKEIQNLKNRYKKEKTSTDAALTDQLNQLEQELQEQWKIKNEKSIQQTEERWRRKNQDLQEEIETLKQELDTTLAKITALKSQDFVTQLRSAQDEAETLQDEINNLQTQLKLSQANEEKFKQQLKYLSEQESVLRDNNERIKIETQENEELYKQKIKELEMKLSAASDATSTSSSSTVPVEVIGQKVKQIMNTMYQTLNKQFQAKTEFSSTEIIQIILTNIKETTLKALQPTSTKEAESSGEEEVESSEEEEVEDVKIESTIVTETSTNVIEEEEKESSEEESSGEESSGEEEVVQVESTVVAEASNLVEEGDKLPAVTTEEDKEEEVEQQKVEQVEVEQEEVEQEIVKQEEVEQEIVKQEEVEQEILEQEEVEQEIVKQEEVEQEILEQEEVEHEEVEEDITEPDDNLETVIPSNNIVPSSGNETPPTSIAITNDYIDGPPPLPDNDNEDNEEIEFEEENIPEDDTTIEEPTDKFKFEEEEIDGDQVIQEVKNPEPKKKIGGIFDDDDEDDDFFTAKPTEAKPTVTPPKLTTDEKSKLSSVFGDDSSFTFGSVDEDNLFLTPSSTVIKQTPPTQEKTNEPKARNKPISNPLFDDDDDDDEWWK